MKLQTGECFICGKPCDEETYCHYECAGALSDHKTKLIAEERKKLKGTIKEI